MIDVEFESICIDCKRRGYTIGFTLQSLRYNDHVVLDLPNPYLGGPTVRFDHNDTPYLIKSIEVTQGENSSAKGAPFHYYLLNQKRSKFLQTFTFFSPLDGTPLDFSESKNLPEQPEGLYFFMDFYHYERPYLLIFYSYFNNTAQPITNFSLFQFLDFDIYGQERFDTDITGQKNNCVFQYDAAESLERGVIAGLASTPAHPPDHFQGGLVESLFPFENGSEDTLKHLLDEVVNEPQDQGVALEWVKPTLPPFTTITVPVILVFGEGERKFTKHLATAREHAESLEPTVKKALTYPSRTRFDLKYKYVNESIKKWCSD